jgi:hypothetical protein
VGAVQPASMAEARRVGPRWRRHEPLQVRRACLPHLASSLVARRGAVAGRARRRAAENQHKLLAPAGRLRARIELWTDERACGFAEACAWRAVGIARLALTRAGGTAPRHNWRGAKRSRTRLPALVGRTAHCLLMRERSWRSRVTARSTDCAVRRRPAPTSPPTRPLRLAGPERYAAERAWQSRWLADTLALRDEPLSSQ